MKVDAPAPRLSLVVPVHNEGGHLAGVLLDAIAALKRLGVPFEIIVVNDGSTDGTADEIRRVAAHCPQCHELRLPQQGGQAVALLAGLRAARGAILATMDGDGQNDADDLPLLFQTVDEGRLDVVCGWRVRRRDSALRRAMSRVANAVRRRMLCDGIHDAGCQLRVLRREVLDVLEPVELLQSFLPAIAVAHGFRVGEMVVRHHPRRGGQSKYGVRRLWWRPMVTMLALRAKLRRVTAGRAGN